MRRKKEIVIDVSVTWQCFYLILGCGDLIGWTQCLHKRLSAAASSTWAPDTQVKLITPTPPNSESPDALLCFSSGTLGLKVYLLLLDSLEDTAIFPGILSELLHLVPCMFVICSSRSGFIYNDRLSLPLDKEEASAFPLLAPSTRHSHWRKHLHRNTAANACSHYWAGGGDILSFIHGRVLFSWWCGRPGMHPRDDSEKLFCIVMA